MFSLLDLVSLRRLFLIAVGIGLAALLFPRVATAQDTAPAAEQLDSPDAVVHVRGMACSMCARRMKQTLEGLGAVDTADVSLDEQVVRLTLKEDQTIAEEVLRTAVTKAGYEFRKVEFVESEGGDSSS